MRFKQLLSSGRIGELELRNRIIMTPMGSNLSDNYMGNYQSSGFAGSYRK